MKLITPSLLRPNKLYFIQRISLNSYNESAYLLYSKEIRVKSNTLSLYFSGNIVTFYNNNNNKYKSTPLTSTLKNNYIGIMPLSSALTIYEIDKSDNYYYDIAQQEIMLFHNIDNIINKLNEKINGKT